MLHPEACKGVAEGDGAGVCERVVGHDGLDVDALASEEPVRTRGEGGALVAQLIWKDLWVGETGLVIDGRVDEVVAAATPAGPPVRTHLIAQGPSATDPRDASKLLHVHVHRRIRNRPFLSGASPCR